jgi:hypothetical protein
LQAIVTREAAERFWAAAGCHKGLSPSDLRRAGFEMVARLQFAPGSGVKLAAVSSSARLEAAADLLGLPVPEKRARRRLARKRVNQSARAGRARKLVA